MNTRKNIKFVLPNEFVTTKSDELLIAKLTTKDKNFLIISICDTKTGGQVSSLAILQEKNFKKNLLNVLKSFEENGGRLALNAKINIYCKDPKESILNICRKIILNHLDDKVIYNIIDESDRYDELGFAYKSDIIAALRILSDPTMLRRNQIDKLKDLSFTHALKDLSFTHAGPTMLSFDQDGLQINFTAKSIKDNAGLRLLKINNLDSDLQGCFLISEFGKLISTEELDENCQKEKFYGYTFEDLLKQAERIDSKFCQRLEESRNLKPFADVKDLSDQTPLNLINTNFKTNGAKDVESITKGVEKL